MHIVLFAEYSKEKVNENEMKFNYFSDYNILYYSNITKKIR